MPNSWFALKQEFGKHVLQFGKKLSLFLFLLFFCNYSFASGSAVQRQIEKLKLGLPMIF
jgi:hypothetical protein